MEKNKIDFVSSGIILYNNTVLMIWHNKLRSWLFPGGHIEENETMEDTVIRECKEEVNIDVEVIRSKIGNLSDDNVTEENMPFCILKEPIYEPNNFHYHIDFVYMLRLKDVSDIECIPENDTKWVGYEDIDSLNTFDNVKKILKKILIKS